MIAMLGMYDRHEVSEATDAFWSLIRSNLGAGPTELTRDMDFWEIWRSPDLLFAQTCGLPYRSQLHKNVQLVGTPDYGLMNCPPGYYHSVIVARQDSAAELSDLGTLSLAYNDTHSQSGWAAFWSHVPSGASAKALVRSGGHANSAKMVASGAADIACLDGLTWDLIHKYDDFAAELRVVERTTPTPGLPYITSLTQDAAAIRDAVRTAISQLDPKQRELLHIKALIDIPAADYLAIPLPPEKQT